MKVSSFEVPCCMVDATVYYVQSAYSVMYRSVVLALVSHPQWPKAMRHTFEYEGKETTPFRHMIRTTPGNKETRMTTHFADSALHALSSM